MTEFNWTADMKDMKRLFWLSVTLLVALCATAQTQQGYVKTKGRKGSDGTVIAGKRIAGATVQVKGRNAVISQANGVFSFPIPANKFYIQSVKKQGYVLNDPEMLIKQYVYSYQAESFRQKSLPGLRRFLPHRV